VEYRLKVPLFNYIASTPINFYEYTLHTLKILVVEDDEDDFSL
jgi:hypothetical protein